MAVERAHPEHPDFQTGKKSFRRFDNRYRRCLQFVSGRVVLDAPCGVGWGTSKLHDATEVHGIDIDAEAIAYAMVHYPTPRFVVGDLSALPYATGYFDTVLCLDGYEHLPRELQPKVAAEFHRVLKPGGIVVMNIPLCGHSKRNPYHLHEPTLQEVEADVVPYFHASDVNVIGTVLWFVGRAKTCAEQQ